MANKTGRCGCECIEAKPSSSKGKKGKKIGKKSKQGPLDLVWTEGGRISPPMTSFPFPLHLRLISQSQDLTLQALSGLVSTPSWSWFLKFTSSFRPSSGNPQKDNFHDVNFSIYKMATFGIVNSTIAINLTFFKGGDGWRKSFEIFPIKNLSPRPKSSSASTSSIY